MEEKESADQAVIAKPKIALPTTPDKSPTREMFTDTFIVEVGPPGSTEIFTLYKGVASFYSGFFAAALKKDTFKEGIGGRVKLPEENIERFRDFVGWIYTKTLSDSDTLTWESILQLWIMADRLDIPSLANATINILYWRMKKENKIPTLHIHLVYQNTLPGCTLRRLLIEYLALGLGSGSLKILETANHLPEAAMWDFIKRLFLLVEKADSGEPLRRRPVSIDLCGFHVHNEGERCPTV